MRMDLRRLADEFASPAGWCARVDEFECRRSRLGIRYVAQQEKRR